MQQEPKNTDKTVMCKKNQRLKFVNTTKAASTKEYINQRT